MAIGSRPVLTIVAGPNGSGKSTLTDVLRARGVSLGAYINADEIEKLLDGPAGEARSRAAQAEAERRRQQCLADGIDFAFETVMSHPSKVALLEQARSAGFSIVLYFVALEHAGLNVERVRQRVSLGGHPVPEDRIVARYDRCLALLPDAIRLCDRAVLFDNSYRNIEGGKVAMRPFCDILVNRTADGAIDIAYQSVRGGPITSADDPPAWAWNVLPAGVYQDRKRAVRERRGHATGRGTQTP